MKYLKPNKILVLLLSLTMVMTLFPTAVFATEDDTAVEKTVSTEQELLNALTGEDTKVDITVLNDIELSAGIVISGNREIVLQGATSDVKITFAESTEIIDVTTQHSMFYLMGGANISMTVQCITLDGAQKANLFYLGDTADGTKNKLTLETGATLQNGYPQLATGESGNLPSGGAVRLQAGSEFVMNDGKIINNTADRYGGGIFCWANDVSVEINGGEISGNTGRYAGGIVLLGKVSVSFHGGKIINNTGNGIHGGGVFIQGDTETVSTYMGGSMVICDNKLVDGTLSDIYFNGTEGKVYIDSALTGDIAFTNPLPKKNISVLAADGYTLTESDATHLRVTSGNLLFYLDTDTNTIKYTVPHTITFNSNIGDDSVTAIQKVPENIATKLMTNTFIHNGYAFNGWDTNQDGTGTRYQDEDKITASSDMVLYAQWIEKSDSTISFKDDFKLDKTYDGNAVMVSSDDYTVTEGAGNVTFSYQVKDGNGWKDIDTAPINAGTYRVKALVTESDTHKSAETDWKEFTISKAMPTYNAPTDLTATVGQTLADVTLPNGFTWQNDTTTSVGNIGTHTFNVIYTPTDTVNYNTVTDIEVTLTVNPKMEEPNELPVINASDKTLTVGDTFNPLEGVTASDKEDGDLTNVIEVLENTVDTTNAGTYTVTYKVTDSKGASSTRTITVTVKAKDTQNPTTDDNKKPSATDTDKKPASTDKQTTSNSPKTGDSTNMTTWLALMFVSLGLLAGVFTVRKSRKSR